MKKIIYSIIALCAVVVFVYMNQYWLKVTKYSIVAQKLPNAMNGLRIVQISDLHYATFGYKQKKLIQRVKKEKPDLIFITGDLVDRYHYDLNQSLEAMKGFVDIAPVYYVTGNHEEALNIKGVLAEKLSQLGIHVLFNSNNYFEKNGAVIQIVGINDPLSGENAEEMLYKSMKNDGTYKVLLAHRPEDYQAYEKSGIDLTFNGHEHGGIIRIPGIGGVIDHNFNLFPSSHIDGVEKLGNLTQVISRGLGNSGFTFRIFNRPEIVVAELNKSREEIKSSENK
ncbi:MULTISPECIES: metallophosphoesterase [unclassified Rummeliibacillus]|uniref:metallophosphoesterase n=2 Tax=Rummeliibacillus TaxID=648802 RepID=UPI001F2D44CB|nr:MULTISPECIES: metallophosphoesterase [unclassified Rummeliibacillus]